MSETRIPKRLLDSTLVDTTTVQTLSNKTLTSPIIGKIANLTSNGLIKTSGSDGTLSIATLGTDYGDVVGPSSATDTAIAIFNGTTGKIIKNTNVTIDANGGTLFTIPSTASTTPGIKIVNNNSSGLPIAFVLQNQVASEGIRLEQNAVMGGSKSFLAIFSNQAHVNGDAYLWKMENLSASATQAMTRWINASSDAAFSIQSTGNAKTFDVEHTNAGSSAIILKANFNVSSALGKFIQFQRQGNDVFTIDAQGRPSSPGSSTGSNNQFFGPGAGNTTQTGQYNVSVGINNFTSLTSGSYNMAFGSGVLTSDTTGERNTGVGAFALDANIGGSNNVAVGQDALGANTSGSSNVGVGNYALLQNATTSSNVAIGESALESNTGSSNVAIGYQAGKTKTSGDNNVFIGYQAGQNATGSNKLYIANSNTTTPLIGGDFSSGFVGIGTTVPTHTFTLPSTSTGIVSYNTSDQTTNYERFLESWSSNTYSMTTAKGGTGTLRNISLQIGGGMVGIHTLTPLFDLEIVSQSTTAFHARNVGFGGSSGGAGLQGHTGIVPTASGDRLGFLLYGYSDGTTARNSAGVFGYASEAWTAGTLQGAYLSFATTQTGTTSRTDKMYVTDVGNIKIGALTIRGTTEGTNQLVIFNGTAPVGTLTNGASFYAAAGEMRVMDSAGNSSLLSPHDDNNEWVFYSKNTRTGKVLYIKMEQIMKALDKTMGGGFIEEYTEDPEKDGRTEYLKSQDASII